MRLGLGRNVIDASNNDATLGAFRREMIECVEAVAGEEVEEAVVAVLAGFDVVDQDFVEGGAESEGLAPGTRLRLLFGPWN